MTWTHKGLFCVGLQTSNKPIMLCTLLSLCMQQIMLNSEFSGVFWIVLTPPSCILLTIVTREPCLYMFFIKVIIAEDKAICPSSVLIRLSSVKA
ncbi:hypothetical protein MtrunA17_Chr3g0114201 [Medicago truncatula]|uniref:Uncharacterized protein n=1 Tax=Medicago truncatula TaxID=3880 RepID=A0A396IVJ8_MEDTR|nr:hypothetical protein MtrunA17_Chr3g0114201 [Medicago truncatula]